jgi:signal transduction histidine kinase
MELIKSRPFRQNILFTILFGVLSSLMGLVMLATPGFEASHSDLREIPLLIAIFHLSHPLFIIPLCLLTLMDIAETLQLIPVFVMHLIPLFITWFAFRWIDKRQFSNIQLGLSWVMVCLVYYLVLLYPILIFSYYWVGLTEELNFIDSYTSLFFSGMFELITTTLVTSLYLVQLKIRRYLELNNKDLEALVRQRTAELSHANDELLSMNENLEALVNERTQKIDAQLNQIIKYAHMNSHQVRGPLARILGLMSLIKSESNASEREDLLLKLDESAKELDLIVREMNRLLEKEMDTD